MRDDELLAIYGATRQLAADMKARDEALKQSTADLEAAIAQAIQLPVFLGKQTGQYVAAGIREVALDSFREPLAKAAEGSVQSLDVAAFHALKAAEKLGEQARLQNRTVSAIILAVGIALGAVAEYYFFVRPVSELNGRFDYLQQLLMTPAPASVDMQAPPQQMKKHGQH